MIRALLLAVVFTAAIAGNAAAQTCSGANCLVISQVYGGGGNSGATLKNDFIELFNSGSSTLPLGGYSVQYASLTGSSWQVTPLSGSLLPGQYYLVQESAGANGSLNLPTPDATGSIAMSATGGKVAVATSTVALTVACPAPAAIVGAVYYNSSAAAGACPSTVGALSNVTSALRGNAGCGTVYSTGTPNPRNTATSLHTCTGGTTITLSPASLPAGTTGTFYSQAIIASGGTGPYIFTFTGSLPPGLNLSTAGLLSGTPSSVTGSPFSFTVTAQDAASATGSTTYSVAITSGGTFVCTPTNTISQIQGSGNTSPLVGTSVITSGIVTALRSNGYFLQMPAPGDGDPNTSDAVFVFTSSAPPAAAVIGSSVCVSGTVSEFIPSSDLASPSTTEIINSSTNQLSVGNTLPAPVALSTNDFNPSGGVFQLERYEGMRVQVNSLIVVGPTQGIVDEANATATSTGVFYGVLPGIARPFREPGIDLLDPLPAGAPAGIPRWDDNPEILRVNSKGQTNSTAIDVTAGATVSSLIGVMDYAFRQYTLLPDPSAVPSVSGNVTYTAVPAPLASELTVSSFNMQHFYDTTDDPGSDVALTPAAFANRLNKASLAIRKVLLTPDILAVEEMENLATLQAVAAKVSLDAVASGEEDPQYQSYLLQGNDVSDINIGFLVKSPKVTVLDVTQYGKNATYTNPLNGQPSLLNDRPPLVLRATVTRAGSDQALPITVVANHLRSLINIDDPATGVMVRAKKEGQAEFAANLIQSRQSLGENVVSVGDYNAYDFNDGYVDVVGAIKGNPVPPDQVVQASPSGLVNPPLTDIIETLPASQRYSYTFDGSAEALDHILVGSSLLPRLSRAAYARDNGDFPEVYRTDPNRPERISDHDMEVAYFTLPLNHRPVAPGSTHVVPFNGSATFSLGATDPDPDTLTYSTLAAPGKGSVTYASGSATYTAAAGASGGDSFTYQVQDPGGLTANGTVKVVFDVTASTGTIASGLGYNRATQLYTGTFTVTNTGTRTLQGPLQILLANLTSGITVVNESGTFSGKPYLTFASTTLAPGQSTTATVQFRNPATAPVSYNTFIYSGTF